jgi:predicted Fe-Mo cluster-binding NifX family protein
VISAQVADTNGQGHGALAGFLKQCGADALICGGIGMGARSALEEAGIRLYAGISGSADEAAQALASGTLVCDPDARCEHHEHHGEGHDCAHHREHRGCAGPRLPLIPRLCARARAALKTDPPICSQTGGSVLCSVVSQVPTCSPFRMTTFMGSTETASQTFS